MLHSRSFLSKGVVVGTFKLDCKTVYDKAGNDYIKKMEFSLFLFTLQWIIFFHTMYAMMLGKYFFLSIHNSSCYYIFGMLWMNLGFFSKWCWSSFLEVKKYFHILTFMEWIGQKVFLACCACSRTIVFSDLSFFRICYDRYFKGTSYGLAKYLVLSNWM